MYLTLRQLYAHQTVAIFLFATSKLLCSNFHYYYNINFNQALMNLGLNNYIIHHTSIELDECCIRVIITLI